ncbi:hypothetical protein LAZ67_1003130, partial [Cordylochernes scorpioides]
MCVDEIERPVYPAITLHSNMKGNFNKGIKIWGRYIDDVFAVIQKEKLNEIIVKLNNLEIGIEFTVETEKEGFIPFLDVGLSRKEDGSIITSVHRKPTDYGIHLNFNSNNPILHKRQVIKSLVQT